MFDDLSVLVLKRHFTRNNLSNLMRVVIVAMLLCTLAFPMSIRADSKTTVVKLWVGNSVMSIDGVRQPIDAQGTKPIIVESRTLVPIRAVIEAFGGSIVWDADARKVTVILKENTLELWIGKPSASLNGYSLPIDSTNPKVFPIIVSGRTMIPLRFVAESLGIDVQYENSTKMITLTYTVETSPPVVQVPMPPVLVSPSTGLTFNNSNITFTWLPVTGADLYRLQITKDSSTVHSANNITTNNYSIPSGTLSDGSYSWQVAAHNSAGWGSWPSPFVFSISTPQQLPEAPVLSLPTSGSTLTTSTITFTWTVVSGADLYKIQILKDTTTIHTAENIGTNSYTLSGVNLENGTYLWQAAAHNSAGWGSWSSSFVFSTSTQMSVTDIAKYVDRVVFIEVSGIKDGKPFMASGSGFIISSDGHIVTNYHVIDYATTGTVTLNDKQKYNIVSVLGYDKNLDLAVIKIDDTGLPVCPIGDSSKIQVGESVVAIGSPLGLPETQNTVSTGIIGNISDDGTIQTQAPISPGSSGGPLFNMYGEVIGVIFARYIGGENMNLAKPINSLQSVSTGFNFTLQQVYEKEYGTVTTFSGTASLISPADESVLTTLTPTLSWTVVSGTDYYAVWVGTGRIADNKYKVWYKNVTGTSVTIPAGILITGQQYSWSIAVHSSAGWGDWSDDWHFSINTQGPTDTTPPVIVVYEPVNGSTVSSDTITVRGKVTDNVKVVSLIGVYLNYNINFDVNGNFSFNLTLSNEGYNTYTMKATDAAGNTTEYTLTIYKQVRSWTLTQDEIQKAINFGKSTVNDVVTFYKPFMYTPWTASTVFKTNCDVLTPYFWVAFYAQTNALSGKDFTYQDAQLVISSWGDKVGFQVWVFGDSIDFAINYSAKIKIGSKTIYPIESNNKAIASITSIYPYSPRYEAVNSYYFNNSEVPRDAIIKLIINNGYGNEETFVIDLSQYP